MNSLKLMSFLAAIGMVAGVATVAIASDETVALTELALVSENEALCEVCDKSQADEESDAAEANFHHHHHHHHHHHFNSLNGNDQLPSPQVQD